MANDIPESVRAALSDRYELEKVLGRGGMATVYLARDLKHNRQVAVKILRPDLAASIMVDRFLREIRIAAQLNHPHIVPLLDSGDASGVLHYVMPFVAGESLRGLLDRRGTLKLSSALQITNEVADALSYAHRQGVIHRDIKPENVLLSEGHAVVADFGIAKAISTSAGTNLTRTGFAVGTLGYMSPEQAAGRTALTEQTDVYSLACVLYEAVIGEPPRMWITDEAGRLGRFIDAPPEHREKLDRLSGSFEQVLVKAMQLRPENRFERPDDFAQALEDARRSKKKFSDTEVRQIVTRAANIQAERPTRESALSLGGLQQIAAEVGIPPEHVREAAHDLQRSPEEPRRGGIFGLSPKIEVERVVDGEIGEEDFDALVREIQVAMGEVGRINQTFGKSLSWNSLSFQNSLPGSGRLTHVIVSPKAGQTQITITESAGNTVAATSLLALTATGVGFFLLYGLAAGIGATPANPGIMAVATVGAAFVGSYFAARRGFQWFIRRRVGSLSGLLDRLSDYVGKTGKYLKAGID